MSLFVFISCKFCIPVTPIVVCKLRIWLKLGLVVVKLLDGRKKIVSITILQNKWKVFLRKKKYNLSEASITITLSFYTLVSKATLINFKIKLSQFRQ